ncbi:hypothetical protein Emtol_0445 [Emticicia oligotrophica DSM 17448]|uniref:GTA TIM-barrel-like domain-containing protein n=1 Tax=Emticicia oligotrophica (strain DSM 17448 / CIP 109782 / MTCC 6937 / GPTSA100-15) TaxID=929562 RepID=A0ABM5MWP6_EMTOG|nr:hypothetical protein [Emticicia oligotrophica]AFK01599.1 hypothetical protein Emtol_0445 [Emticicia oligotrophica DSM 17448]
MPKAFFLALTIIFYSSACQNKPLVYRGTKLKGVCFVAPPREIDANEFDKVKEVNATWVALTPYGFTRGGNPEFKYNKSSDGHWWGESPKGVSECAKMAHEKGLKIMLKPHAWIQSNQGSTFTGDLDFKTDEEWKTFEKTFGEYLIDYAKVADSCKIEVYCIATEFENFVEKRPEFWHKIIKEIRGIYKGQLTYAENWDCYEKVPFWNELDFVGVDAYFPLADEQHPQLNTIKKGWYEHRKKLEKFSSKIQKPILFTEIGYQSTDFTTHKPWESYTQHADNDPLQADAYRAFFEEMWQEQWLAGCFIWKWFPEMKREKEEKRQHKFRDRYTPQGKAGELVLKEFFKKQS